MGNWSCLTHWIECKTRTDANKVYTALNQTEEYFSTIEKTDRWAAMFGYITDSTIQITSSQKWGLSTELAHWACSSVQPQAIVQAGIDRDEFFSVCGSPKLVVPVYNCLYFFEDYDVSLAELEQISKRFFGIKEDVCFGLPHFNESDFSILGSDARLISKLVTLVESANPAGEIRIAFGRKAHASEIFLGELYTENDDLSFEFTGRYNKLKQPRRLGTYLSPHRR